MVQFLAATDKQIAFPATQKGMVRECPHCGAYMDVEDSPDSGEWWREPGSGENAEEV